MSRSREARRTKANLRLPLLYPTNYNQTMHKLGDSSTTLRELEMGGANNENEDPRPSPAAREVRFKTPKQAIGEEGGGGGGGGSRRTSKSPSTPDMSWMEGFHRRSQERSSSRSGKKRRKRDRSSAKRRRAISGLRDLDVVVSFNATAATTKPAATAREQEDSAEAAINDNLRSAVTSKTTPPELRLRRSAHSAHKERKDDEDEDACVRLPSSALPSSALPSFRGGGGVLRPSAALKYVCRRLAFCQT